MSVDHGHRSESASPAEHLRHIIAHASHYLPAQGPIGVFIHHNTLHAFQHMKFEDAVLKASNLYGTEPYMREEAFQAAFASGRIRVSDIEDTLAREPNAGIGIKGLDRRSLRLAVLREGVREPRPEDVHWLVEEGELGPDQPGSALFQACRRSESTNESGTPRSAMRPRDGIRARNGIDLDETVNPALLRLAGAFLDQGVAYWTMPEREQGFLHAVRTLWSQPAAPVADAFRNAKAVFSRYPDGGEAALLQALADLGVPEREWEPFLEAELLALPGWAGMFRRLEEEPHLAPHDRLPCTLADFLAVRLILTVIAVANIAGSPRDWRHAARPDSTPVDPRLTAAARLYFAAKACGLTAADLDRSPEAALQRFREEVLAFDGLERRRLWQIAYERRHERQILLPLGEHRRAFGGGESQRRLAAQVMFCIDEREESIRRHLEEVDPEIETFAAAGFFGVAVNYTGIDDAHGVSLCPVVVTPQHAVIEQPRAGDHDLLHGRKARRRAWAALAWNSYVSTRTLFRGWLSTMILGVMTIFPLAARVLAPRRYSKFSAWINNLFLPEPRTELTFMRSGEAGHHAAEGLLLGFDVQEKVDRVASVLAPAGLVKEMARIVVVLGHGSTSLNNPHESAHDCGACGGRRGGPNARLFAAMANHPEVRQGLRAKGIFIPEDTWFVGGYHDTCNDDVDLFDLESVPASHQGDLARVRKSLDEARAWSAHERARRFEAAPDGAGPQRALHHVEERAEHLAEPRPEYGHCTNSVCIVGRRSITRGLFFDRRAFLVSYDAAIDPDDGNLGRLLGAVIPVCGGISLEYYFSFVDNEGYGCGTKLPHNITGLIGVMNGFESDLRTGLPWQMVEIHEPVRILFVIETTPERALRTIHANPLLAEFLDNRWIRLATIDPATGEIHSYKGEAFEPVTGDDEQLGSALSSGEWYGGKREHLPVARIGASRRPA